MLVSALVFASCGSGGSGAVAATSGFPRTTKSGVELTIVGSVESVPKTGCFTLPEGTDCEVDIPVLTITATAGDRLVQARLNGTPEAILSLSDSLGIGFLMWVEALETDGDMVVAVVSMPASGHTARMIADGNVIDEAKPTRGLVVLASSVGYDDIRLIDDRSGAEVASCPRGGLIVGAVNYPCTPPEAPSSTTIPAP